MSEIGWFLANWEKNASMIGNLLISCYFNVNCLLGIYNDGRQTKMTGLFLSSVYNKH